MQQSDRLVRRRFHTIKRDEVRNMDWSEPGFLVFVITAGTAVGLATLAFWRLAVRIGKVRILQLLAAVCVLVAAAFNFFQNPAHSAFSTFMSLLIMLATAGYLFKLVYLANETSSRLLSKGATWKGQMYWVLAICSVIANSAILTRLQELVSGPLTAAAIALQLISIVAAVHAGRYMAIGGNESAKQPTQPERHS
jgi:4-amino-4-deoxy-L-arabinose transferase-like glycosyltransferase